MTSSPEIQGNIKKYLLGQLAGADLAEIERRVLTDDEFYEEVQIMENELVDEYVNSELSADERQLFEKNFLADPESRNKLRLGRALDRHFSAQPIRLSGESPKPFAFPWAARAFSSPLRIAAFALIIAAVAFGAWRIFFHQSEVDKGLLALNAAYREQRPLEARISSLSYAPFPQTRGTAPEKIDENELSLAELTLLKASKENPTPQVRHALGKVLLAKKEFDKAIEQFDEAVKADPKNAQLYSDLGAAWLEKGRIDVEKGKADPAGGLAGKGLEELGRSLNSLNKALELNANLLEALFNRALCHQWLRDNHQAADDWREYLRQDPNSPWAEEATQRLRQLEAQNKNTSQSKEQLLQDFLAAYQISDDESAWAAISRSGERKGNFIVEGLLDDYLKFVANGRTDEADSKLRMLSYEAKIEVQKASDRFTSDLVRFYINATPAQRVRSMQGRQIAKLANDLYYKVEFEKALALYPKAHELFMQAGNECEALFALSWTGYCYLRIPKVNESRETFEHVSKIYGEKSYRSLEAQSLNGLSDAELSINEFSKSLNYANRSLRLSEEINDRVNVVRSYGQIVSIQLNVGSYSESLSSMFKGLSVAETSVFDPTLLWHFYHEAALAYYFEGLTSAAFDCEKEAERLADISHNSLLKARSLDRLALLFERTHDYERAIALLNQALNEAQSITGESSKAVTEVHTTLSLGQLYREMGNLPQAIDYYDRTLYLSRKLDNLEFYLYQSHKGKLLALIGLHDDVAAEQELRTVVSLFEDYRNKIVEESYRNRFFDIGQDTYDSAVDFEYSRQADFEKAFQYAEAYRARSLFDLMTNSLRLIDNADRPESVMSGTKPLNHLEIQNSMSDKAQILEYSVLDDRLVMWIVTKNVLEHADSKITAAELSQRIDKYRDALARNRTIDNQELTTLSKELYAILITPVESRGYLNRDRQLCIVPDKSLNFLPFAALISPLSSRYLIEDYAIEVSPSATIFAKTSENASRRGNSRRERLLSVGDPRFDRTAFADLPALPSARREAQEVATYYQPGASLLIDDAATLARVKRALRDADIAHFATHALADGKSPLQSKLLLANESPKGTAAHHALRGFLQASEIYNLRLPRTRLVILSACQTGIEQAYRGEGAIGLARPFIAAGVPLVVASLWPVDSAATAELMISFHKHRKQDGVSTVEALRLAQLEMLKQSDQSLRNPYTWAAFVPIGGYAKF